MPTRRATLAGVTDPWDASAATFDAALWGKRVDDERYLLVSPD